MRAFASTKETDSSAAHLLARGRGTKENTTVVNPSAYSAFPVQRKAACACGGGCPDCQSKPAIQTKLSISEPGDIYEQEADRVADQVMRMPDPVSARSSIDSAPTHALSIQRKCTICEDEEKLQRKPNSPLTETSSTGLDRVAATLRQGGQPLDANIRNFFEPRFGYDFSKVRVHAGAAAEQSAREVSAKAYTVGHNIVFGAGRYAPGSHEGRRLIAHELTHVVQQDSVGGTQGRSGLIQRNPETWYRGEAEGVVPARPNSVIHDFGDGLYLTDDPTLAARYASLRAGPEPTDGRVVAATFDRPLLGNILDLSTDPRWAAYMRETTPHGITHEQLIRMANENYWSFFQEFLRRHGLALENFDTIIGPEYVRNGTQMCIRNPGIAAQVRGMLGFPSAGGAPAEAPAEYHVESRFRVLSTEEIPGGRVVSDVEVVLGGGLDAMNGRVTASGGRPLPASFILRITTDANGALVAAEASSSEAAALAETLARQALLTAPRAGAAGAGTGVADASVRAVSPWVRGASWFGLALFAAITIYRDRTARPEDRPRVRARAGGGLAGGMAGGYVVCNLVLGIETLGWSLLICGAVVGVPAGMAGEAIADVAYDEATIDDDEIRVWVSSHSLGDIERLPAGEKLQKIFSLMRGWISEEDVATIERILGSVRSADEMAMLRWAIEPHITEMTSIGQRTQVRVALVRRP